MSTKIDFAPEQTDYHIHCNLDKCAMEDMTLANIYDEAVKAGLREICVIKHYSHELPNKADVWVNWKRTTDEAFEEYLDIYNSTPIPDGLRVLTGVETELLNSDGDINIPQKALDKIDLAIISNHWLPDSPYYDIDWVETIHVPMFPNSMDPADKEKAMAHINRNSPESYVRGLAEGNANAVRRNPKAKVLAHLCDVMHYFKGFCIRVEDIPEEKQIELVSPIMDACIETGALWEVTPETKDLDHTHIIKEANKRGVKFTGTVDAHALWERRWGHTVAEHNKVEDTIKELGLTRSSLSHS